MAFQKKVVILSDITSQGGTGIVKITEDGDETVANVNIFCNVDNLILLLNIDQKLSAFNIENKNILNLGKTELKGVIDCLVVDNNGKALLYGSTGGDKYRCFNLLEEYRRQDIQKKETKKENKSEKSTENITQDKQPEILSKKEEKTKKGFGKIDENLNKITDTVSDTVEQTQISKKSCDLAVNNENIEVPETDETDFNIKSTQPILNEGVQYEGDNFYLAVKPQLDEMFICYPSDKQLTDIVPNSKWIRVSIEDDYYVVGIIFELDEPKYICYGIHGFFSQKPPAEIENICEWLPLNLNESENEGYWLIYQSASTGKTLKNI